MKQNIAAIRPSGPTDKIAASGFLADAQPTQATGVVRCATTDLVAGLRQGGPIWACIR
jgi:hypothetical protein